MRREVTALACGIFFGPSIFSVNLLRRIITTEVPQVKFKGMYIYRFWRVCIELKVLLSAYFVVAV
jgi:hypothetical protein